MLRAAGRTCCTLALPLILLPARIGAAAAAPATRFTRFSVEDGLSQSTVQVILQDQVGFVWLGTEEGLNRFDGYSFTVFKHDPRDPGSLPEDTVSALYEDRQKRLWVGTGRGLSLFDRRTETFTRFPSIDLRVNSIVEDPDGTLWVGSEGEGLFERNPASGAFVLHQHNPDDPSSLASYAVSALLRDRSGRLWVGTRDAGLDLMQQRGKRFLHHRHDPRDPRSLSHDEVWGLAEDAAGDIWIATYGGGMNVLDHTTGFFRHHRYDARVPGNLRTDFLTSVLVDRSGTLWIGTNGAGVQQYEAASGRFLDFSRVPGDARSLSRNVVRSLYEDAQGQLWVGTYMGGVDVMKRPRRVFGYFTHTADDPSSLSDPAVSAILEDAEGRLWVGTEQGWLNRFDPRTGSFVRYRYPSSMLGGSTSILALCQDRRGRIWVGSYRGGLGRFDPQRGTFTVYSLRSNGARAAGNDEVWALAEDEDGALWLGTDLGLDRFDPERGVLTTHYETPSGQGLSDADVRALLVDRHGNLWVGTLGGLDLRLRGGAGFVQYRHDDNDPRSLSHDGVFTLCEDRSGQIWVGTFGGGLNRLDQATGTFTVYRDFPSNVIYGIQQDAAGRLWLSTNRGLSCLDPASGSLENFDLTNGLQSVQFHMGASHKTRGGRMLFGSVDGFYDFEPEAVKPDAYAPPVVFTTARILNEPARPPGALAASDAIVLPQHDKVLSVEFAALDYTFPRRNRYAYFMDGFSDQWVQLENKRDVTFTNLDPGTYVLHVKASNSDGVWSDASAAALRVFVRPTLWQTWWFRGASLAFAGLALLAAHRLRVRQLLAAERKRAEGRGGEPFRSQERAI